MWLHISTRRTGLAFAAVFLAAVVIFLLIGSGDGRTTVQTTGVLTISPVATIGPNSQACQRPVVTASTVDAIGFNVNAAPPRPKLVVTVRDTATQDLVARGVVPANFDPGKPVSAELDHPVPGNRSVSLCVTNRGHRTAAVIYGDNGHTDLCAISPGSLACRFHFAHPTSSVSEAFANGQAVPGTMNFVLTRRRPESLLSQLGAVMRRASTFRPGFVGPWMWWILLVTALLLVPAAMWWGLRDLGAAAEDRPSPSERR
jgi:regulator of extracellular matrix RemA (YlzA/DUF370 family)